MSSYETFVEPANVRRSPIGNELSVSMMEWGYTDNDSRVLRTAGLACCLGVAAYDRANRIAHLAHFWAVKSGDPGAEAFFDSVVDASRDESKIKVWLRGANVTPCGDLCDYDCREVSGMDECQGVVESREFVVTSLVDRGLSTSNMDIQWNDILCKKESPRLSSSVNMKVSRRGRFESNSTLWQGINKLGTEAIKNTI